MKKKDWDESPDTFQWDLRLFLYIEPPTSERVVIPFHRCEGRFSFLNHDKKYRFRWVNLEPPSVTWARKRQGQNLFEESKTIKHSKTMDNTVDELLVDGPGKCFLNSYAYTAPLEIPHPEMVFIDLTLYVSNDTVGIPIQLTLPKSFSVSPETLYRFYWIKNPPKHTDEIME
jgi:hypothetical protein